jgi:hypothetical protein
MKLSTQIIIALSCLSFVGCPLIGFLKDFKVPEECFNGFDDDGDDASDCEDTECSEDLACITIDQLIEIDLGVLLESDTGVFDIPEGTIGFSILLLGDLGESYGINTLENPDGELLIQGFSSATMNYFIGQEAHAIVMPSNDASINAPIPGQWKVSVASSGAAPLVKVFVRLGPFQRGLLDLKLYFPQGLRACADVGCNGGQGDIINAQNAASFAEIQGALNSFFVETFQASQFLPGNVQFFDIDSSFLTIDSFNEYSAMLRQSFLGGSGGVHIFFTQDFDDGDFPNFIGFTPALPGAFFTVGNQNSALAVQMMFDPEQQDNLTGAVMSHEVGHFLGLAHTTEFDGNIDFVSDTPSCDPQVIGFGDQSQCPDVSFVMFPTVFPNAHTFSAGQQLTLQGGPLYR